MADKLETYRKKRSAAKTPEPMGGAAAEADQARFVIQEHHATRLHWDLRLERGGVLVSFAIPNGLPPDPGVNRMAVHTEDHPLEYLDFHGEIPKGEYGAGSMTIWDHGTYECLKWEPKKIEVALHGEEGLAQGKYALFQTKGRDWMIHRMDPPADPAREPMPERIVPMLATLATEAPEGDGWAFEIKWDGVRAIAYSEPGRLHFESRNLRDITASYPELSKLNRALSHHSAVLDGEIVAFDENGRPSFGRLQHRMHVSSESAAKRLAKTNPVVYVVFDLLWLDGHSLMDLPYEERRARLTELDLVGANWQTPEHVVGAGADLLAASEAQGLEGIVAKRLDCPYEPGPPREGLAEGQEQAARGVHDRRLARGGGEAQGADRRAARREGRPLRRPRRDRLHRGRARPARQAARAVRARHAAGVEPERGAEGARSGSSRTTSPRSSSASGRTTGSSAIPRIKGSWPRSRSSSPSRCRAAATRWSSKAAASS